MTGGSTAYQPRASADAPGWAARLVQDLVDWVLQIRRGPQVLTEYTVTTLPDPTKWKGAWIAVTNETGGYTAAISDGTNFRRMQDRNIVS